MPVSATGLADVFILPSQVSSQERVFISHAGSQKDFALHLRTQLRQAGISSFVDMRERRPDQADPASALLQPVCQQAQLVIFVITRDFLRQPATIQQLRWALAHRQMQPQDLPAEEALPRLLTVLYPTSVCRSRRNLAELQQLLESDPEAKAASQLSGLTARLAESVLSDASVHVHELQDKSLARLLRSYHPERPCRPGGQRPWRPG